MLSNLSLAEIGGACLAAFFVLQWLKCWLPLRTALAFTGVCLLAGSATGAIGFDITLTLVTWIESLLSDLTYWVAHIRIGALVLFIVLGGFVAYNLWPKNKTHKHTGWAALALAFVLIAGVAQIPWLSKIPGDVRTGVSNARSSVQSSQGG